MSAKIPLKTVRGVDYTIYIPYKKLPRMATVKTLNIGTPRPATIVVLNIKQFNFTTK